MMAALEAVGLCKNFGAVAATGDVSISVQPGECHALIGPNGAGKTTLITLLAGELRPDRGAIRLRGRDVTGWPTHLRARAGLGRSFQIAQLFPEFTAEDNAALAVQATQGHSFRFWRDASRDASLRSPAREALARAGLADRGATRVSDLSHGERRQLELALVLARRAEVLLLDEPMAGLGPEEGAAMTRRIASLKGGVGILLVEHDMDAVFALADRISVLVRGRIVASGAPDAIRRDPAVKLAYLGDAHVPA